MMPLDVECINGLKDNKESAMKILLFCCKGFEMMEFAPFVDVMGWARTDYNLDVEVVTSGFTEIVNSAFNVPINVDVVLDNINVDDYDALAIPGGFEEYGFYEEAYDERFLELIREFNRRGKYIASICVGALPIGASGVLTGRRGTTYHFRNGQRQNQLAEFGVDVQRDERIVIDGNVMTSFCPETAPDVAFQLLRWMVGEDQTEVIKHVMGY